MQIKKILLSLQILLLTATLSLSAENILMPGIASEGSEKAKLIVIITVQDLDAQCLSDFYSEFKDGGFKRFAEGTYYPDVEFPYITSDYATDIATIFTGTTPCFHSIISEKRFDAKEMKYIHSLYDKSAHGLNDDLHLSGKALVSTTFADRLYERSYGASKIVSVATHPTIAMLMTGHSGLPIYMNNLTGEWSTSSYYTDNMPKWLEKFNSEKKIDQYLDKNWTNLYPAAYYASAALVGGSGFNYSLRSACSGMYIYDKFATTPQCNDYVCDLALKAMEMEGMGKDLVTDLLMVNFSLSRFFLKSDSNISIEHEDAYLRLDKTLKRFLENIENRVGRENLIVMLIGSRTCEPHIASPVNRRLEYTSFNTGQYSALLNSYLMAHYGQKNWVLSCKNGNIYLNHQEIEKSGISLSDMRRKAMEFFYLIPGIQNLCTAEQMEEAFYSTGSQRYPYCRNLSGDLLYSLMPRWYETDLKGNPTGYFTSYITTVPLYIYGGKNRTPETKGTIKATFLK